MSNYILRPDELITGSHEDSITAAAVGSGIVLCLYDEQTKTGGMCYFLGQKGGKDIYLMYSLLEELISQGVPRERLWAKLVGGATIFCLTNRINDGDIGKKNVEYVRRWLQEAKIPIRAEDTGNNFGRTVSMELEDGNIKITLANRHIYDI